MLKVKKAGRGPPIWLTVWPNILFIFYNGWWELGKGVYNMKHSFLV